MQQTDATTTGTPVRGGRRRRLALFLAVAALAGTAASPIARAAGEHVHHGACDDSHAEVVELVEATRSALAELYPDGPTMMAKGYIPYFDAAVPGGYPPGGSGVSHWLNPDYIGDGILLDPTRPESILMDEWYRPIGAMFIADDGVEPPPVYVNEDGSHCHPWHPHTDAPATFSWWFYRTMYRDGPVEAEHDMRQETAEMMHLWTIHNPHGVFAGHDYPPPSSRQGPPVSVEGIPGS